MLAEDDLREAIRHQQIQDLNWEAKFMPYNQDQEEEDNDYHNPYMDGPPSENELELHQEPSFFRKQDPEQIHRHFQTPQNIMKSHHLTGARPTDHHHWLDPHEWFQKNSSISNTIFKQLKARMGEEVD